MADTEFVVNFDTTSAEPAKAQFSRFADEIRAKGENIDKTMRSVNTTVDRAVRGFRNLAMAAGLGFGVGEVIKSADAWSGMASQLRTVQAAGEKVAITQERLFKIAQDTRTPLQSVVTLYARMDRATSELGVSQDKLFRITETINKAVKASGAGTQEASAAILQLSQGLALGALRGQELNSVMEQTPRLAKAIADGMGVAYTSLRTLAKTNSLTTEEITNALLTQGAAVDSEFGKLKLRVSEAFVVMQNAFTKYIGEADQARGTTQYLSQAIVLLSENLDTVTKWIGVATAAYIAYRIASFNATSATAAFTAALMANPLTAVVVALTAVTAALYTFRHSWNPVQDSIGTFGDYAASVFIHVRDVAVAVWGKILTFGRNTFLTLQYLAQPWFDALSNGFRLVMAVLNPFIQMFKGLGQLMATTAGLFVPKELKDWAKSIGPGIVNTWDNITGSIRQTAEARAVLRAEEERGAANAEAEAERQRIRKEKAAELTKEYQKLQKAVEKAREAMNERSSDLLKETQNQTELQNALKVSVDMYNAVKDRQEDEKKANDEIQRLLPNEKKAREAFLQLEGKNLELLRERILLNLRLARQQETLATNHKEAADRELQEAKNREALREKQMLEAEKNAERLAKTSGAKLADPFTTAMRGIQTAFTDAFRAMIEGGNRSWDQFTERLKNTLMRVVAEMAAKNVLSRIFGDDTTISSLKKKFQSLKELYAYFGGTADKMFRGGMGVASGIGIGLATGNPLAGAAGGAFAGFQAGGPLGAVAGAVTGFVTGMLKQSSTAKAAEEKMRQALKDWNTNLQRYVDGLAKVNNSVADALRENQNAVRDMIQSRADIAKLTLSGSGAAGIANSDPAMLRDAIAALSGTNSKQAQKLRAFYEDSLKVIEASNTAAAAIKANFAESINRALNDERGFGGLNTVADIMKAFEDEMRAAVSAGVDESKITELRDLRLQNFFKGLSDNDFFRLLPQLSAEMQVLAKASRDVVTGITENGKAMLQENELQKLRNAGNERALLIEEARIEKQSMLDKALKEGLSPQQIADIAATLDEKLAKALLGLSEAANDAAKQIADARRLAEQSASDSQDVRYLIATGQTAAGEALRAQQEHDLRITEMQAQGISDVIIEQERYIFGLEKEARAKEIARLEAEKAAERELTRVQQNTELDKMMLQARIDLNGAETEQGRILKDLLDDLTLRTEREELLKNAVDAATTARYKELFALQDQARAALVAREAAQKLADELKKLVEFTNDVDVEYLKAQGKNYEAEQLAIKLRYDKQMEDAKKMGATQATLDKIEFNRKAALNKVFDEFFPKITQEAVTYTSSVANAIQDTIAQATEGIASTQVMGQIGGVSEVSFGNLLSGQQSMIALLARIELNTRPSGPPPVVEPSTGAIGGEVSLFGSALDATFGRHTRNERYRRGRQQ